jgi:hypothetical protein
MKALFILLGLFPWCVLASDEGARAPITWGAETNGLRAGVAVWQSEQTLPEIYLTNACSYPHRLNKPDAEQRFRFTLIDQAGKPVKKRREGPSYGQPLSRWQTSGKRRRFWVSSLPQTSTLGYIVLHEAYEVESGSRYKLKVEVRLFGYDTNKIFLQPVMLPPVEVDFIYKGPRPQESASHPRTTAIILILLLVLILGWGRVSRKGVEKPSILNKVHFH